MRSRSLNGVPVTVVATRGEAMHVFDGHLKRADAIKQAHDERSYEDGTIFVVLWQEVDVTEPGKSARLLLEAVRQAQSVVFK